MLSNKVYGLFRNCSKISFVQMGSRLQSDAGEQKIEKSLNTVTLLGRVGGEAKKGGSEERPVVYFSLATSVNYTPAGGDDLVQKTDWHRIVVFKPNLRDTVYNYLRKGQRVYVSGRLTYGEITDATGSIKPTTAIVAENVIFFQ